MGFQPRQCLPQVRARQAITVTLPAPYPIYARDEERIVAHGFPVLISPGIQQLRREIERHVVLETDFRLASTTEGESDKREVMAQRERYVRSMSAIIENTLLNDYGHGLFEVLLLFHSADVAQMVAVPTADYDDSASAGMNGGAAYANGNGNQYDVEEDAGGSR